MSTQNVAWEIEFSCFEFRWVYDFQVQIVCTAYVVVSSLNQVFRVWVLCEFFKSFWIRVIRVPLMSFVENRVETELQICYLEQIQARDFQTKWSQAQFLKFEIF